MATWNRRIDIRKKNNQEYLLVTKSTTNAEPPPVADHPRNDTANSVITYEADRKRNGAQIHYHSLPNEIILTGIKMKSGRKPSALNATVHGNGKLLKVVSTGKDGTDWRYYVTGYYVDEDGNKIELQTDDPRIRNRGI